MNFRMETRLLMMILGFIISDFSFTDLIGRVSATYRSDLGTESLDFCLADTFNASCPRDQVLLMLSARFGRMRKGRCVKGDYGALGCSVDALDDMHSLCSGLRDCKFRIFDSELRLKSVCPEDMTSYLEARYRCIDVTGAIDGQCGGQGQVNLTQPSGHLASTVSQDYGVGTAECPWSIHASPGQKIAFYLRYFGYGTRSPDGAVIGAESCHDLLTFHEPGSRGHHTVSTCDGVSREERQVFSSRTHEIQVQLVGRMQLRTLGRFIVRYQVTGCADMSPPFNATIKRDKDEIIVKCNNSDHTWHFVCKNSMWLGDTVTCNQVETPSAWNFKHIFDSSSFPFGILVVVAIGVALGIFSGGLLLTCAVVYMKRRRRLQEAMDECTDFRNFYEGHVTGDLNELTSPEDVISQTGKAIHPYTTKHLAGRPGGDQGSSFEVSSLDRLNEYGGQLAIVKAFEAKAAACPKRCCYPSLIAKNHLYETPRAV